MFGIGISEVLVVLIVAVLLNEPRKLSSLVKEFRAFAGKIKEVRSRILEEFDEVEDQRKDDKKCYVEGDDGRLYEAYDVECIKDIQARSNDSKDSDN